MPKVTTDLLMSTENECLTVLRDGASSVGIDAAVRLLIAQLRQLAPSLPSPSGTFTPYGNVYPDTNMHLECAALETDSPYLLATALEQLQKLVAAANASMKETGTPLLLLANNNHSGRFAENGNTTWGAHENYLVEEHPTSFAQAILPMLATRVYAGAGAVESPNGRFFAGVRAQVMDYDVGGSTTGSRALHSTARDEGHMGPSPQRWRYHLICGDGHRSQFNVALQFGATALAVKAILFDPGLAGRVPKILGRPGIASWRDALRRFNVLAPQPGQPPRVDPLAIEVQRVYLEGARAYVKAHPGLPAWTWRLLDEWDATLWAMEAGRNDWLAQRLDAWIKHALFSAVLEERGVPWSAVPSNDPVLSMLAVVNQNYHDFTSPDSLFAQLEASGAIEHRVAAPLEPGGEPEPWVPQTRTRAAARARMLIAERSRPGLMMDWSCLHDAANRRFRTIYDPFAAQYSDWVGPQAPRVLPPRPAPPRQAASVEPPF
jgi:hypothetical protein